MKTQQKPPKVEAANRLAEALNESRLPQEEQVNRLPEQQSPGGPLQVQDVLQLLTFRRSRDGQKMCRRFMECQGVLATEWERAARFFAGIAKLNGFPECPKLPPHPLSSLNLPKEWAKGMDHLATVMEAELQAQALALVTDTAQAFVWMVKNGQAGQEKWFGPDSCEYEYCTYQITQERKTATEQSSTRNGRATTHRTETEYEKIHKHSLHVHGLVDARRVSVDDPSVDRLDRAQWLIDLMPSWMRTRAYLIVGTQVKEQIIERDVRTEKRTAVEERVVYDPWEPGLAVGGVVFFGWTGAEMEAERQAKETVRQQKAQWARLQEQRQREEQREYEEQRKRQEEQRLASQVQLWVLGFSTLWILLALVIAPVTASYFDHFYYAKSDSYEANVQHYQSQVAMYNSASWWDQLWGKVRKPYPMEHPWWGRAGADVGIFLVALVGWTVPGAWVFLSSWDQLRRSH